MATLIQTQTFKTPYARKKAKPGRTILSECLHMILIASFSRTNSWGLMHISVNCWMVKISPEQKCVFVPHFYNSVNTMSVSMHDVSTQRFLLADNYIHLQAVVENISIALIHGSFSKIPGVLCFYCTLAQLKHRCLSVGNELGCDSLLGSRVNNRVRYSPHTFVVHSNNYAHCSRFGGLLCGYE